MPTQVYVMSHPPPEVPYARKVAKVSFVCASVNDMKSSSIGSAVCGTNPPSVRFIITFFPFAFDKSALEIPYLLHRYSYWIAPIISSANISGKAPITIAKRVKNTAAGDHFSRQVSHLLSAIKILTKTTNAPKSNNPAMSHLSSCYRSQESGQQELTIQNSSAMNFDNWSVIRFERIPFLFSNYSRSIMPIGKSI